ncbi:hypothetical protein YenMTG1_122 [Yersinia phage vB_YenM_TG1]|uniref:Uncharacterized protein n=1 Tax=Yersinia phage vB_YenM_TG1 TaxID=1589265 RepID=A0A0B4ZXC0_9CAUD|nr:hypothetical protein AVV33_gp122 [Yersinia phage vB_YenM_TG1]AJD81932.1 hypothetical protein YenMTG1_122 [Yersinia phage vB_YenM_TG1]
MNRYIMVDGPFKKVAFLSEHTIEELQDKSIVNSGEYRYVTLLTKHGLGVQCPSNICFDRQIKVYPGFTKPTREILLWEHKQLKTYKSLSLCQNPYVTAF